MSHRSKPKHHRSSKNGILSSASATRCKCTNLVAAFLAVLRTAKPWKEFSLANGWLPELQHGRICLQLQISPLLRVLALNGSATHRQIQTLQVRSRRKAVKYLIHANRPERSRHGQRRRQTRRSPRQNGRQRRMLTKSEKRIGKPKRRKQRKIGKIKETMRSSGRKPKHWRKLRN